MASFAKKQTSKTNKPTKTMPRPKKTTKKKAAKQPSKATKEALKAALESAKPVEEVKMTAVEMIEPDDFQNFAPPAGVVPLARGETVETAPKDGAWIPANMPEEPVKAPESPVDASELDSGSDTPEDTKDAEKANMEERLRKVIHQTDTEITRGYVFETLSQLVDGIQYLAKKNKHLSSKDKHILRLRIERARRVQRQFQ